MGAGIADHSSPYRTIFSLNLDTTAHRVYGARKLRQCRIIENAETVSRLSYERLALCQLFRRLFFGGFHLSRISCHVSGKDCGQAALHDNFPRGD
jgi:hypothetical protein